jgi:hypothetical protein
MVGKDAAEDHADGADEDKNCGAHTSPVSGQIIVTVEEAGQPSQRGCHDEELEAAADIGGDH